MKDFCFDCKLRSCDEQAVGCLYRLNTRPNYKQKRRVARQKESAKRKALKRANETPRTRYWREWKQLKQGTSSPSGPSGEQALTNRPFVVDVN